MLKMPENIPSKYLFVLLVAERAKQLQLGAAPLVKTSHVKPTYRAMDELMNGKLEFVILDKPVMEPWDVPPQDSMGEE